MFIISVQAQKHETGIHGGWLYGYPKGEANSSIMKGGWSAGGYYRYTVNRWVGVESGLDYTRKKCEVGNDYWENSLSIPLNVIVFPSFRFSLFGGVYMKNRLGTSFLWGGTNLSTGEDDYYILKEKKPAFGYNAGVKWNMKYWRLVIFCQQDLTSWVKDFHKVMLYEGWPTVKPYKSFSINLTAEIPLWRNKKK